MRTLEEIRGRCVIEVDHAGEHWLWKGALRPDGRANIYAPDHTKGGRMSTQAGPRAVWHCHTGEAIPDTHRVFGVCEHKTCCNPACIRSMPPAKYGRQQAKKGTLKNRTNRILANRAIGRARSSVDPQIIAVIQSSPLSGVKLAEELQISRTVVSKARKGQMLSFATANVFSGLGAR